MFNRTSSQIFEMGAAALLSFVFFFPPVSNHYVSAACAKEYIQSCNTLKLLVKRSSGMHSNCITTCIPSHSIMFVGSYLYFGGNVIFIIHGTTRNFHGSNPDNVCLLKRSHSFKCTGTLIVLHVYVVF